MLFCVVVFFCYCYSYYTIFKRRWGEGKLIGLRQDDEKRGDNESWDRRNKTTDMDKMLRKEARNEGRKIITWWQKKRRGDERREEKRREEETAWQQETWERKTEKNTQDKMSKRKGDEKSLKEREETRMEKLEDNTNKIQDDRRTDKIMIGEEKRQDKTNTWRDR